MIRKQSLKHPH